MFGCDVHFLLWLIIDSDGTIFVQCKGYGGFSAVLHFGGGEAEPAVVDAESDFVGADFDYGVVRAVESVGGCVAAEQGCPGGPEFGVEGWDHWRFASGKWSRRVCSTLRLSWGKSS